MGKRSHEDAVSPVIGILLMIVVTVIIAAIVSGFAGSLVNSQAKIPEAQFTAKFSIGDGMSIRHAGGDAIPTKTIQIILKNSNLWGPSAEERTVQVINKTLIQTTPVDNDPSALFWELNNGEIGVAAFKPGDTAYISPWNCTGTILQPSEAPSGWTPVYPDYTYTGSKKAFWGLMFRNPDNIGKSFIMEITDSQTGKLISRINVPIVS
jgi:FlaG/FlaF family flagellin (archaellin)